MNTLKLSGLSSLEVEQRKKTGAVNVSTQKVGKSVADIVKSNIFTRINFLLGFFFILVLSTGSIKNGLFGLLIIINSAIGIFQEIRAKRTLDKLSLLSKAKVNVIRDGKQVKIFPEEIVLDDLILAGPGEQIVVDGIVVQSDNFMVNESMLTGESDPIAKVTNDKVLSGSFVSSGSTYYKAISVGDDSYATKLVKAASEFTLTDSQIMNGINYILKIITWIIVPVGLLTIYSQFFKHANLNGSGVHARINKTILEVVAALVPMIPEGLVLMTSIAFAMGVIRLGRKNCLVQELPAIEGLARVSVVCADKTGTLTDSSMQVQNLYTAKNNQQWELIDLPQVTKLTAREESLVALENLVNSDKFPNDSFKTLQSFFEELSIPATDWQKIETVPFSSIYKWSGGSFAGKGSWIIGAYDVLLADFPSLKSQADSLAAQGIRILVFGKVTDLDEKTPAYNNFQPNILIAMQQNIRPDAAETLDYFRKQKVEVKVISGDNPVSVAAVTGPLGVGVDKEPLDARTLVKNKVDFDNKVMQAAVIGRVTPLQKQEIVHSIQHSGKEVAMTGDGVNDVLALKAANIGISMGSGSAAARSVAQIVLLDNKFSTLPAVVGEGRRVIGNIERVSKLFLSKTIYSVVLALLIGLLQLFKDYTFPFQPVHTTIISWFTIGVPAFILSLAPNNELAKPHFVRRVLQLAIPMGIVLGMSVFITFMLNPTYKQDATSTVEQTTTSCLIALLIPGIWLLCVVARPLNNWKLILVVGCFLAYMVLFTIPIFRDFASLNFSNSKKVVTGLIMGVIAAIVIELLWKKANTSSSEPVRIWQGNN